MNKQHNTLIMVGAGLLVLWYLANKAGGAVAAVGEAVDPSSRENLVYRTVNQVGDVVNDGEDNGDFSLGAWIYNLSHEDEFDTMETQ